jgi:hypothetical protein
MPVDILGPLKNLLANTEQETSYAEGTPTLYIQGYRDALKAAIELLTVTQSRLDVELTNQTLDEAIQNIAK